MERIYLDIGESALLLNLKLSKLIINNIPQSFRRTLFLLRIRRSTHQSPFVNKTINSFYLDKIRQHATFFKSFAQITRRINSIGIRRFSSVKSSTPTSLNNNFVMFFKNVLISKRDIYKQLKGKSGVYLFINNLTGKLYVGSSLVLSKRMASHFYHANSSKDTNIILYRAMKKYQIENFSLAILEFCKSDIIVCSDLEQK
jgi:hypothetical protein